MYSEIPKLSLFLLLFCFVFLCLCNLLLIFPKYFVLLPLLSLL